MTDPLATTAQYEQLVGPPPAGLDLTELLAAASDLIRTECGWHIAPVIAEEVKVDGPGGGTLMLPTLRLVDVTSIDNAGTTVDPLDAEWSESGFLRKAGCWTSKLRGVTVSISHGYDTAPAGLIALACTVAARAAVSPSGVVREQVGSVALTYSQVGFNVAGGTALLKHEIEYLAKYKLPPRP